MEIVSYVLSGELAHKDSMGNGTEGAKVSGVIKPGDVQRMSAGRGVLHSEFNNAPKDTTHFLQIWIEPNVRGIEASYEQKHFDADSKRGTLRLVASPDGRDNSVTIHADASIYSGLFDGDQSLKRDLSPARKTYVHVVRGSVNVNGQTLAAGDAVRIENETSLSIDHGVDAELLMFDLH
jgi:redox-sensitive bicupin YhaK (pirin superfamily)